MSMAGAAPMASPMASVVIPAHDEAALLGGTLRTLLDELVPGTLEVVVVANGCSDDTVAVARAVPGVRVVEIPEPSKSAAVALGNRVAATFPRVHLDADCAISGVDVLRLVWTLDEPGVLAAGPARVLDTASASWWVRGYYRVWEQLPGVREGLYGRGVIALTRAGQERVDALPPSLSDDLAVSDAFDPRERRIVPAASVAIRVPRTARDLLRRRVRVVTGNHQADLLGLRRPGSATSVRTLLGLAVHDPWLLPRIPIFVATGLLARARSRRAVRRGDYTTWLRDDSSRISGSVSS
jgi:hypothetical protein